MRLTEPVDLNGILRDPAVLDDPYSFYRELRTNHPRATTTPFGAVAVSTYADAVLLLRDPRFSTNPEQVTGYEHVAALVAQSGLQPLLDTMSQMMLLQDPPAHTRMRRLIGGAFTARRVEEMRGHVQELVDGMLDELATRDRIDVVADLANRLPIRVMSEMMGFPSSDHEQLHRWTTTAAGLLDPLENMWFLTAADELAAMFDYFRTIVAERRRTPGDDLVSAFLAGGEDGDRLSEEEIVSSMMLLVGAGQKTTASLIGNSILALLRWPGEMARLRQDPGLTTSAIEEVLRFDSPIQLQPRIATEDVEVNGLPVARGQTVIVLLGAANRDPAQFDEPDRFDIGRINNRHVAFGGGIHLCLGAPLARLEAQVAVPSLLRRFPDLRLTAEPAERSTGLSMRGLHSLPVRH